LFCVQIYNWKKTVSTIISQSKLLSWILFLINLNLDHIMMTIRKRLAMFIFLALISTATLVACGGKQAAETEEAEEHPADSEEHPAAADSTDHPAGEHPSDSTSVQ
jgi:hypothetical protein